MDWHVSTKRNALHAHGRIPALRSPASRFGPVVERSPLVAGFLKKYCSKRPQHRPSSTKTTNCTTRRSEVGRAYQLWITGTDDLTAQLHRQIFEVLHRNL